ATNHVMNGSCGAVDSCVHDAWPQPRYHQRSSCYFTFVGPFIFECGLDPTSALWLELGPLLRDATSVSC
ncbi:hypothetical protein, partial [Roseiconus lacunae]|uniref:hypothetical protein n=1 Tax=Roseiconus lacunae TaxID=2605694 RepID=UPI001E2935AA